MLDLWKCRRQIGFYCKFDKVILVRLISEDYKNKTHMSKISWWNLR